MEIELVVGAFILLALVFLATVDLAFAQLSDLSLRKLSSETDATLNERSTKLLRTLIEDRARFRFALSSTIQFLLIAFTVLITFIVLSQTTDRRWILLFALVLGLVVTVLFRQIIPRLLIRNRPVKALLFLLPVIRPLYYVATILTSPISGFFKKKDQLKIDQTVSPDASFDDDDDGNEDLQALMEVGEAEGIIEEDEREMIESMFEFTETRTGEIMTPRTEICAVPVGTSIKDARDLIIEEKYSRLPVYRESIDNIEGMIYVRDLLSALADGQKENAVETIMRDAFFVPETKTAADLLKSMQSNHVQFAIVIDEYGGVAGIVTVEDILEEIVGEIEDEDTEAEEIIEIVEGDEGYWDVLGSTEVDKIERLFDIEVEDDEFTTIAGLVTSEAGYVPKVGESVTAHGLQFEVLRSDEKRVELVRIRRHENGTEADDIHTTQN